MQPLNPEFLYQMQQKFAFHQIFEYCMNTYNVMLNAYIHFISPRASCICLHIIYLDTENYSSLAAGCNPLLARTKQMFISNIL